MRTLVFLVSLVIAAQADAIDRKGNGGNIIFCQNVSSPHHLQVLDTYEAGRLGWTADWGAGTHWKEFVGNVLNRWTEVAPKRMTIYREWLANFEAEAKWSDGVAIEDPRDRGHLVLPLGCELRQIAMQRPDEVLYPGMARYEIDNLYWSMLSERERAAFVLHEIILREAINDAHQDESSASRYFNGFLSGARVDGVNYFQAVTRMRFAWAEFGGGAVIRTGRFVCGDEWSESASGCRWVQDIRLTSKGLPASDAVVIEILGPIRAPGFQCEWALDIPPTDLPTPDLVQIGYGESGNVEFLDHFNCRPRNFFLRFQVEGESRIWDVNVADPNAEERIAWTRFRLRGENPRVSVTSLPKLTYRSVDAVLTSPAMSAYVIVGTANIFLERFGFLPVFKDGYQTMRPAKDDFFTIDRQVFSRIESVDSSTGFTANGVSWQYNQDLQRWEVRH